MIFVLKWQHCKLGQISMITLAPVLLASENVTDICNMIRRLNELHLSGKQCCVFFTDKPREWSCNDLNL